MAFEPQTSKLEARYTKRLEKITIQTNLTFNTNGEKIEKVLFTRALPCVSISSVNAGNVNFDVKVEGYALVLLEGGDITTLTSSNASTSSYNNVLIMQDSQIFANTTNIRIENVSATDLTVSFTCAYDVSIILIDNQNINYISSAAPANEKVAKIDYNTITSTFNQSFELSTEIDLPNGVKKVLLTESTAVLKDASVSNDLVTLHGELFTRLIYLTNDEKPKLKTELYQSDFHQEVLATGVTDNQKAFAGLMTCSNAFEIQGELESSKGIVLLKNGFNANIFIVTSSSIDFVVDAFCPYHEMNMNHQSFISQQVVCEKTVNDKIDGNIAFSQDDVRIDKVVMSSTGFGVVDNVKIVDSDVVVSGTAYVNVVYLLDDDNNTMQAVQVEIPFESVVRCDDIKDTDTAIASVVIKDTEARNKRAKEIDVLADIILSVRVLRDNSEVVLNEITLSDSRQTPEANMGLYVIDQAEDLWTVAKALLINPDVLMEQNPNLTFPITKPTQVFVYRQEKIDEK